ncbi:hypothetical protein OHA21_50650 [Actinoplanes sp. NBC_00393]|uniref:hypothetical protein n=1 Tax=Actinoplanes sp. NBC_00393 TaxID=2975953 RepID=UPI002E1FECD0
MAVEELNSQESRNDRGVLLRSVDRETMQVEYQGRTLDLDVDRAPGSYGFYLPSDPFWNDGTSISEETMSLIKDSIREIRGHKGVEVMFKIDGEWIKAE